MKESKKGFVIPIVIFIFAIISIAASIYYFYSENKAGQSLSDIQNKLLVDSGFRKPQTELEKAKQKAADSISLLSRLLARYAGEQDAITSIQDEYSKLTDLLPGTTGAMLKKRLPADVKKQITLLQQQINTVLNAWKAALLESKSKNPDISLAQLVAEAKKDVAALDQYTKELQDAVATLTPENSGLTQAEIDALQLAALQIANAAKKEEQVIAAIEDAAAKVIPPTPTSTPNQPVPDDTIVTPADIQAQKDAVAKAQEEQKKEEEAAGVNKDIPLPTPTADIYSSYDNNRNATVDPSFYDDLTSSGKPQIDGSPRK